MKKKNGLRHFFTLNVHNHEGFTLVELIVVIAILAILAGVAVPAYNGYIKKANQAADETLLAALNTAYAAACASAGEPHVDRRDVGSIVLSDGQIPADHKLTDVAEINQAFGAFFGDGEFKYYKKLNFDSGKGIFTGSEYGSTFDRPGVMSGIENAFNGISNLLVMFGVGDPEEIEEALKYNLGENVSTTLGLDDMLDGYLKATQLDGDELKAALEQYCPEYAALTSDAEKEAWIANNADKIKLLKANLGVMHFANSANTGDSEQLLGNVMDSMDSIVDAAVNFTMPGEEDIWAYYASTPRGQEQIASYSDANAAYEAMRTDTNSDFYSFMNTEDSMLGLYGGEMAALSMNIGTGTNEAGINTLGAMYALSAGYFNSEYYEGGQGETVQIGTFPTVVDALTDPGFQKYYEEQGEADIAAYLEQMRNLSNSENLDLTQSDMFTGVFTGGSN